MVEKLLSSSCLRSITAESPWSRHLSLNPAAAASTASPRHPAYSSRPAIENNQRQTTKATAAAFARVLAPILGLIRSLEECRTAESPSDREGFNSDLTHRHFRRSVSSSGRDWLMLGWADSTDCGRFFSLQPVVHFGVLTSPILVIGWHPWENSLCSNTSK